MRRSDVIRESRHGLDVPYLRGLGADETLGQEQSLAYMIDGTRSTIGLVDSAGSIAQTFAYEPFGLTETSGPPDRARYLFTGRERDADWLYYYRARYYSPRLMRFLQPDPLGRAAGSNLDRSPFDLLPAHRHHAMKQSLRHGSRHQRRALRATARLPEDQHPRRVAAELELP